jgi:hypothetical protein
MEARLSSCLLLLLEAEMKAPPSRTPARGAKGRSK